MYLVGRLGMDAVREGGHRAYVMLISQFLVEWCAHDHAADAGRCTEVGLSSLPPRGVEGWFGARSVNPRHDSGRLNIQVLIFVMMVVRDGLFGSL